MGGNGHRWSTSGNPQIELVYPGNTGLLPEVLVNEFFTCYRVCNQIHLDQGSEFDYYLLKEVCGLWRRTDKP